MNTDSQNIPTLWINGRFLQRPISGVERVAHELLGAVVREHLDDDGHWIGPNGCWKFRLVAPESTGPSPWAKLPVVRKGPFEGHLWEQTTLARVTSGQWLFNPCNTGPAFKRKQLTFLHDAQPMAIPENFSGPVGWWYRRLYRQLVRNSRKILVNSRFTRDELVRLLQMAPSRSAVCMPGSEHIHRISPEVPEGLPGEPFLLALASANPNKNMTGLAAALDLLGDSAPPCVVVGQRNQAQFAQASLDHGRVTYLGRVSDERLAGLYQAASGLVFPSHYEGFGLPPLEAMALGCPVIVSQTGALPEVCGPGALYCDPRKPETIARAIEWLMQGTLRNGLAQWGITRARQYSWQDAATSFLAELASTALNHRQRPGLNSGQRLQEDSA